MEKPRKRRRRHRAYTQDIEPILNVRRTPFDLLIVLFLLSLGLSAWLSFSSRLAFVKLLMGLSSVVVYYGITAVSRKRAWYLAGMSTLLAAGFSVMFIVLGMTGIGWSVISRVPVVGWWLASVRLFWPTLLPHANVLGGLMAMMLPFTFAFTWYVWKEKKKRWLIVALGSLVITLGGLALTRSVGAWIALFIGLGAWWSWLTIERITQLIPLPRFFLYMLSLVLLIIGGVMGVRLFIQFQLPGGAAMAGRLDLGLGTWKLAQDFFPVGSGLATFAPLYSEYIRSVPNYFVAYGNFYFDLLLEMGPMGLLCILGVWVGSGLRLIFSLYRAAINPAEHRTPLWHLRWATLAAWIVVLVHGFTDDVLFGGLGTPFLFFVPALAVLVSRRKRVDTVPSWLKSKVALSLLLGLFVVGMGLLAVWQRPLRAQWTAASGARLMDEFWLSRWPIDVWRTENNTVTPPEISEQFAQALALNPNNRTAQQRMGMIALVDREFETAVNHLQIAHEQDITHRGITKQLGYAYVWLGQLNKAEPLLATIPEASRELDTYVNWWERQKQPIQAGNAELMQWRLPAQ